SGTASNWVQSTAWNVWRGTSSSAFGTAGNWSLNSVPTSTDHAVIASDASNMTVQITSEQSLAGLGIH
ncbi:MAG TPA: hypothetical protein DCL43_12005, partial [Chitinophagaceae bacterium]|nr:hypothetical protein [Chitinophagaceae bacterium]